MTSLLVLNIKISQLLLVPLVRAVKAVLLEGILELRVNL